MIDVRCIYVLCEPGYGAPRYVGQSADPFRRLELHVAKAFRQRPERRTPVEAWVHGLVVAGRGLPAIEVVEFTDQADAAERRWIEGLSVFGADLLNVREAERLRRSGVASGRARLGSTDPVATRLRKAEAARRAWAPGGARRG